MQINDQMDNSQRHFAILDENNVVIDIYTDERENLEVNYLLEYVKENNLDDDLSEQDLLKKILEYIKDDKKKLKEENHLEYSLDKSITNNQAVRAYSYNENLNAFIPPKPEETYILDTETFEWYPNPDLIYDFDNDGVMIKAKYIKELKGWQIAE
jgi:hypothetical protein